MGFVVNDAAEVRRLIIVLTDDVGVPSGYISPQLHLMVLLYARYNHIRLLVFLLFNLLVLDKHSGFASTLRLALVDLNWRVRLRLLLTLGVINDVTYIYLCILLLNKSL